MSHKTNRIWGFSPKENCRALIRLLLWTVFFLGGSRYNTIQAQQSYSLEEIITLQMNHTTVAEVLEALDKQTNYSFTFSGAALKKIPVEKVDWKHVPLKTVLNDLKRNWHIEYLVVNATISFHAEESIDRPKKDSSRTSRNLVIHVSEDKTDAPLEGATVSLGNPAADKPAAGSVAITDGNGEVFLSAGDSATLVTVSMVGYTTRTLKAGDGSLLMVKLQKGRGKYLNSVTIHAHRKLDNEAALLNQRKNAAVISDGISAADIDKTASITTVQALQRITGVTTTDDKYVAIRGVGDRNVVVQINGSRLSSSDPDHNSVAIDIIPAGFLDNINVYKTNTPDRPADAVAGIVELRTKAIPDTFTVNITCQLGTNSNIGPGGTFTSFHNADLGFFGQNVKSHDLSPGFTALASEFPQGTAQLREFMATSRSTPAAYQQAQGINNLMHSLDPNLVTDYRRASLDQTYGITVGNRYTVFRRHELGIVVGFNYYHRTEELPNGEYTQWSIYRGQNALPADFSVAAFPKTTFSFANGDGVRSTGLVIPAHITPDNIVLGKFLSYSENMGKETTNYGAMASLGYRFSERHVLKFSYIMNRGAEAIGDNQAGGYSNSDFTYPILQNTYMLRRTYKTLDIWQGGGDHSFRVGKLSPVINWTASTSYGTQDDPDYRYVNLITNYNNKLVAGDGYQYGSNFATNPVTYFLGSQGVVSDLFGDTATKYYANANGRLFRYLTERNYNATIDLQLPFRMGKMDQLFKAGAFYLERDRRQQEHILYLPQMPDVPLANLQSDANALPAANPFTSLFGNSPMDPSRLISYDKIGFTGNSTNVEGSYMPVGFLYNVSKSPANFNGYLKAGAFYGMLDLHPLKDLRVVGGVRFELSHIRGGADTLGAKDVSLIGANPGQNFLYVPHPVDYNAQWKAYPSGTIIYSLHENMKFRLAYSKTFARPELREILPIVEFDPIQQAVLVGNPSLVNQTINAVDFRWEWFPSPGEVFAVSAFGKRIDHQIEKAFIIDSAGVASSVIQFPVIHFVNDSSQGKVYGMEFEARKHLGALWSPLNHFFIGANLMLAASEVNKNPQRLMASRFINRQAPVTSPLFEQPPYSLNVLLDYDNPRSGSHFSLSYNEVGERLVQVELTGEPDIYTRPQPMLNFVFGQQLFSIFGHKMGKRLLFKGYVKNLLNSPYQEVYTIPGNGGKYFGYTYTHRIYHQGLQISLGAALDLF